MRPILKRLDVGGTNERHEVLPDDCKYLGEDGASSDGVPLIVPFAELKNWHDYRGRLGVRLSPADPVEDLAEEVGRLSLVAIEFPSAGEGRGYSQARLLRSARFGFKGEVRAVGPAVKQDLLFIMARCGFDAFELSTGQKLEEALKAFER